MGDTDFEDEILFKVFWALLDSGLTGDQAQKAIMSMQKSGIFFGDAKTKDDHKIY